MAPKTPPNKKSSQIYTFSGFTPATFTFLKELKENNTRDWFEAHRDQFNQVLQTPFQNLVVSLIPPMIEIDPQFEIKQPKKMISRIYRDLRFSKDKSPYRPNMWLSFHRITEDWKDEPGFFFRNYAGSISLWYGNLESKQKFHDRTQKKD